MQRESGRIIVALLLFLSSAAADAQAECLEARSYESTGQLDTALDQFRTLLVTDSPPACAIEGARRVQGAIVERAVRNALMLERSGDSDGAVTALQTALVDAIGDSAALASPLADYSEQRAAIVLQRGRLLRAAGNSEAAREAFAQVLSIAPGSRPAIEAALATHRQRVESIRRLISEGSFSEARSSFEELGYIDALRERVEAANGAALEEETDQPVPLDNPAVPSDLQFLKSEWSIAFHEVTSFLRDWSPWVLLAVAVAVVVSFVRVASRALRGSYLEIVDFDNTGIEAYAGPGFAAMVRSRLNRLCNNTQSDDRIELVTAALEPIDIPEQVRSAVPDRFAWIAVFLPWLWSTLFPRTAYRLSGYLHPVGSRGPGVTLQLAKGDSIAATQTFWQIEFLGGRDVDTGGQESSYYRLADYGATWLTYKIRGPDFSYLGTSNWRALALSRAAYFASAIDGQTEQARALLVDALCADPEFDVARYNLALIAHEDDPEFAISLLDEITERIGDLDGNIEPANALLYPAIYNRGAWLYQASYALQAPARNDKLRDAEQQTAQLHRALNAWLDTNGGEPFEAHTIGAMSEPTRHMLQRLRQMTTALLAGLRAANGDTDSAVKLITETPKPPSDAIPDPGEMPAVSSRSLTAATGATLPPSRFSDVMSSGVQYNLACACSVIAERGAAHGDEWLKRALQHLERALVIGWPADGVDRDNSLNALRNDPALGERYRTLLRNLSVSPQQDVAQLALADAVPIGEEFAARLADANLETLDQIILAGRTALDRQNLARQLGVSEYTVGRWVDFADLARPTGMTIADANVLWHAGIQTRHDLAHAMSPDALYAAVTDAVAVIGAELAPRERYASWIAEAGSLPQAVF